MQQEIANEKTNLISAIISEVEKLGNEEKKKLLIQLRNENILEKAKSLDSVEGLKKEKAMTDEEAYDYVSHQRKLMYEQSKA